MLNLRQEPSVLCRFFKLWGCSTSSRGGWRNGRCFEDLIGKDGRELILQIALKHLKNSKWWFLRRNALRKHKYYVCSYRWFWNDWNDWNIALTSCWRAVWKKHTETDRGTPDYPKNYGFIYGVNKPGDLGSGGGSYVWGPGDWITMKPLLCCFFVEEAKWSNSLRAGNCLCQKQRSLRFKAFTNEDDWLRFTSFPKKFSIS